VAAIRRRLVLAALLTLAAPSAPSPETQAQVETVATGVLRPLQIVWDGHGLIVLSYSARGDSAGELYRIPIDSGAPVDLTRRPAKIPFRGADGTTLGSLAREPESGTLFVGEENGTRIWRLGADERLTLYVTGLRRLAGGGTVTFDRAGRLILIDYADPYVSRPEERLPPGLEQLRLEEDYLGPLVFRLALDTSVGLPRRLENVQPLYPRGWGKRRGGAQLPQFSSVTTLPNGDLLLLASSGVLHRIAADGSLTVFAALPRGQYTRTNLAAAADGAVYVSGGFHVGQVFRVSRDGAVETLASDLADPEGIAVDGRGAVYVAESSLHRIVRLR
jgi:hypothetical protein